jgi:hypothetical protein
MMVPFDPVLVVKELAKSGLGVGFGKALGQYFESRERAAFTILLEEIRSGDVHSSSIDPVTFAGMAYRYHDAAMKGVARVNLRIIARLLANATSKQDIIPDEFNHFADVISSFRREELVFLVELYRQVTIWEASGKSYEKPLPWDSLLKALVPRPFNDEHELLSVAQSASRSGFVIPGGGFGNSYYMSPQGKRIIKMSAFEAALEQEAESPVEQPKLYRGRGILKGKISVSDEDLFESLPDEELKLWNEGDGR